MCACVLARVTVCCVLVRVFQVIQASFSAQYLYALNGTSGQQVWALSLGATVVSAATLGPHGVLFLNAGPTWAVNMSTGVALWTSNDPNIKWWIITPSCSPCSPGSLLYTAADVWLYALSVDTGAVVWQTKASSASASSVAVDEVGSVYQSCGTFDAAGGGFRHWGFAVGLQRREPSNVHTRPGPHRLAVHWGLGWSVLGHGRRHWTAGVELDYACRQWRLSVG
jgi:outer membrane protein assembly factor BamB